MMDAMFCPSSQWWKVLHVASLRYGSKRQLSAVKVVRSVSKKSMAQAEICAPKLF